MDNTIKNISRELARLKGLLIDNTAERTRLEITINATEFTYQQKLAENGQLVLYRVNKDVTVPSSVRMYSLKNGMIFDSLQLEVSSPDMRGLYFIYINEVDVDEFLGDHHTELTDIRTL